jgi:hypothetical protein
LRRLRSVRLGLFASELRRQVAVAGRIVRCRHAIRRPLTQRIEGSIRSAQTLLRDIGLLLRCKSLAIQKALNCWHAGNCEASPARLRTPPGKNSTSLAEGDIPGGTSDGSNSVTQLPNTLSGNGEKDSIDMSSRSLDWSLHVCSTRRAYCSFLKIP